MKTEHILGYDVRIAPAQTGALWPQSRRDGYLYRADVQTVLSVDTMVWPALPDECGCRLPSTVFSVSDLWPRLPLLRTAVECAVAAPPHQIISVSLVAEGSPEHHPALDYLDGTVELDKRALAAPLLGFDVADTWLLSALTNCGFLPGYDDIDRLREHWAPHLNDNHLFTDLDAAIAFREMSDQRLAGDHAPTFVYAIRELG